MDRLKELKKGATHEDDESDLEMGDSDIETNGTHDAKLDGFFKEVEQMKQWMSEIRVNMGSIRKNYTELLQTTDTGHGKDLRKELTDLRNGTGATAQKMRAALKKMRTDNDEFLHDHDNDPSLCKIRTNMHGTLVRNFFDLMQEYQTMLSQHDAKMREKAYRQVKLVAPDADQEEIDELLDAGGDVTEGIFSRHIMEDRKHQKAQQTLDYLQEKHNDILDLEKSIAELHQLFMDMAILVEAQGDLVDQIQFSVATSKAYHVKAERTLGQAEKYVKRARKKKCIAIIIIIVTVVIILAIIAVIIAVVVGVLAAPSRN